MKLHKAARRSILLSATATVFAPFVATGSAHAQEVPVEEGTGGIADTIVVTANKRSENLQKVPISVSAFSGEQIDRLGITDTTQITQQIPSLRVNAFSPNLTIFSLRGISQNNFTDNLEAPVAVYQDNAYIASMNAVSGQLFDIKRVEVLRGPQGTLFGRNATGGLIHYLSEDASTDRLNGYVQGQYGRFNDWSLEGAVGGGLSEGFRFRAAARVEQADGYIKSRDTDATALGFGVIPGSGQDLGGKDGWAARLNIQADLSPDATLNLWYKHSEDNSVATGGYVFENCIYLDNGFCDTNAAGLSDARNGVINAITAEPASPWEHFGERPGSLDRVMNSYQGQLDWDLGGVELTSITNYLTMDKVYQEDGDALPFLIVNVDSTVDFRQFSQELRLAGETGLLSWQVGAYYLDMRYDGSHAVTGAPIYDLAIAGNGGFSVPKVDQQYLIDSENWSIFAQGDLELTDRLTLTLGGRYSKDNKAIDYANVLSDPTFAPQPDPIVLFTDKDLAATVPGVNREKYGDWAARVSLNFQATPDTLLFASWNRGIKGGNWSLSSNINAADFRHDPETLNSFEAGFKTTLLDGDLRLNGTAFHYIYDDYQAFSLAGGVPQVFNSDAHATGAELEAFWSPSPRFDAVFGGTWETSSVDSIPATGVQFGPELFPGAPDSEFCTNLGGVFRCDFPQANITDAELPNAPRFSLNYLLRYNVNVASGNVAAQVDGAWYDDQFLEVTNGLGSLQEAYNVTNVSLTYEHDDTGISLTAWARNVFDQEYRAYALNLGILGVTSIYAPPATYGATLRIPFGR
ncbi:TonB-dependent receptor [Erythrobacter sp. GH3-10]|uniref:TonB-dependent receptor n=2 Tax=Aurantiacibacter rhizosphaerae TaxID=2691582 RepID=A0A844XG90_9SPHN|nr:TonB-dependent receptor [Aurantiacibacter rhizosphaerae]